MNEESQAKPMDEKRKTALLRYLAILFAVAFLLVLISMLCQLRNTRIFDFQHSFCPRTDYNLYKILIYYTAGARFVSITAIDLQKRLI